MKTKPYKVRIHYTTGDSFGSRNCYESIDTFANKDEADQAAILIRDHYEYCCKYENAKHSELKSLQREIARRPWFVFSNAYPNDRKSRLKYFQYSIALFTNYEWINYSVSWVGYFESLVSVDVYQGDSELDWEYWEETYT